MCAQGAHTSNPPVACDFWTCFLQMACGYSDHIMMHGAFSKFMAGAAVFSHDAIAIGNE